MMRIAERLARARQEEQGYALITAMLILSVLSILMALTLANGISVNNMSERGNRWTRVLGTAESGVDVGVATLGANRSATSTCPIGGTSPCASSFGQYEVSWEVGRSAIEITSIGYYPSKGASDAVSRTLRVVYKPEPLFKYALFGLSSLDLKNNSVIHGDVYGGAGGINFNNNTKLCGNATTPGAVTGGGGGAELLTSDGTCTSHADIWAGGDVTFDGPVGGDVTSSGQVATCAGRLVTGQTIAGKATSCGATIQSTASGGQFPNKSTVPPSTEAIPTYAFTAANYPGIHCYPAAGACDQAAMGAAAVTEFNAATGTGNVHSGTYAVWQTVSGSCLSSATPGILLPDLTVNGDLTIVTNTRIEFSNQGDITYSGPAGGSALVTIISLCNPSPGAICSVEGSGCSISGKNGVQVIDGSGSLAALLYTPGPIYFKNNFVDGGATYGGTLNVKNNGNAFYDPMVLRTPIGFGGEGYVRDSWQELGG
jgi:hypothetical protein